MTGLDSRRSRACASDTSTIRWIRKNYLRHQAEGASHAQIVEEIYAHLTSSLPQADHDLADVCMIINRTFDLDRFVTEALGVQLETVSAQSVRGLCPLHEESSPSFMIEDAKSDSRYRSWFCYGCNRGGTIIDLMLSLAYHQDPNPHKDDDYLDRAIAQWIGFDVRQKSSSYSDFLSDAAVHALAGSLQRNMLNPRLTEELNREVGSARLQEARDLAQQHRDDATAKLVKRLSAPVTGTALKLLVPDSAFAASDEPLSERLGQILFAKLPIQAIAPALDQVGLTDEQQLQFNFAQGAFVSQAERPHDEIDMSEVAALRDVMHEAIDQLAVQVVEDQLSLGLSWLREWDTPTKPILRAFHLMPQQNVTLVLEGAEVDLEILYKHSREELPLPPRVYDEKLSADIESLYRAEGAKCSAEEQRKIAHAWVRATSEPLRQALAAEYGLSHPWVAENIYRQLTSLSKEGFVRGPLALRADASAEAERFGLAAFKRRYMTEGKSLRIDLLDGTLICKVTECREWRWRI